MSDPIARISSAVADVLAALDADLGQRFRRTPINPRARYSCVSRSIVSIQTAMRARWATRGGLSRSSRLAPAVEALDLLRAAVTASLGGSEDDLEWLSAVEVRVRVLAARVNGMIPSEEDEGDASRQAEGETDPGPEREPDELDPDPGR